jgi:hypothetical protein
MEEEQDFDLDGGSKSVHQPHRDAFADGTSTRWRSRPDHRSGRYAPERSDCAYERKNGALLKRSSSVAWAD